MSPSKSKIKNSETLKTPKESEHKRKRSKSKLLMAKCNVLPIEENLNENDDNVPKSTPNKTNKRYSRSSSAKRSVKNTNLIKNIKTSLSNRPDHTSTVSPHSVRSSFKSIPKNIDKRNKKILERKKYINSLYTFKSVPKWTPRTKVVHKKKESKQVNRVSEITAEEFKSLSTLYNLLNIPHTTKTTAHKKNVLFNKPQKKPMINYKSIKLNQKTKKKSPKKINNSNTGIGFLEKLERSLTKESNKKKVEITINDLESAPDSTNTFDKTSNINSKTKSKASNQMKKVKTTSKVRHN